MLLVISPAIDGLKPEWREASESLGGDGRHLLAQRGHPRARALVPRRDGAALRQRLRGPGDRLRADPRRLRHRAAEITNVLNGNVVSDPHFGQALALGMIVVITCRRADLPPAPAPRGAVDEVKRRMPISGIVVLVHRRALLHRADRRHGQVQPRAGPPGLRLRRLHARSSTIRSSATRSGSRSSSRSRRPS